MAQVFDEAVLTTLRGHIAVGHCRYSTTGVLGVGERPADVPLHAGRRPGPRPQRQPDQHPGAGRLLDDRRRPAVPDAGATSDTDVLTALFARPALDAPARAEGADPVPGAARRGIEEMALATLPLVRGAYSLVFMDERTLYAARDPQGFRPLVLGRLATRLGGGQRDRGAGHRRGQLRPRDRAGRADRDRRARACGRRRFAPPRRGAACSSTSTWPARTPPSPGRSVQATRVEVGRRLAAEHPADGRPGHPGARVGHARPRSATPRPAASPTGRAWSRTPTSGRTFIQPSQTIRQRGIRLKLNPLRDVIAGKRLVVVDDSIVRGNTQRAIVAMLREAGAAEVHVRISSPPVSWPCFYGIDFATRAELIAGHESRRGDPRVDRRRLARLHLAGRPDRRDHAARGPAVPGLLRRRVPDPGRGG